jgi:hypothetical protein
MTHSPIPSIPVDDTECDPVLPYTGAEKRADWHTPANCTKLLAMQQRLDDGGARMARIEASLLEVQAGQVKIVATQALSASAINEVLEIISAAKGFFKGASVIGSVIKWGLGIATAVLAFVLTLKSGGNS